MNYHFDYSKHFAFQQELTLLLMPVLPLSYLNYIRENLFIFIDYLVKKQQTMSLERHPLHLFKSNVYSINNYSFININYCYPCLQYFKYFCRLFMIFLGITHYQFFDIVHLEDYLNQNPFAIKIILNFIMMTFGY